jgi:hypothetical protein
MKRRKTHPRQLRANSEKELSTVQDGDMTSGEEAWVTNTPTISSREDSVRALSRVACTEAGAPPKIDRVLEVPDDPSASRPLPTKHCRERVPD